MKLKKYIYNGDLFIGIQGNWNIWNLILTYNYSKFYVTTLCISLKWNWWNIKIFFTLVLTKNKQRRYIHTRHIHYNIMFCTCNINMALFLFYSWCTYLINYKYTVKYIKFPGWRFFVNEYANGEGRFIRRDLRVVKCIFLWISYVSIILSKYINCKCLYISYANLVRKITIKNYYDRPLL